MSRACAFAVATLPALLTTATATSQDATPIRMPVLVDEPWRIGDNPDLGELGGARQEVVDHAIWRARDGRWQLWACIRGTAVGRVLYAWQSAPGAAPTDGPWERRGIAMRASREHGESIDDWGGQQWIQAPHVIEHGGRFHMLFGGHRSELEHCQINLATSDDGREFVRHRDERGFSRVFVGPGEARDPMVLTVDGVHHCYYSGNPDPENRRDVCGVYCRTSTDLVAWSEPVLVCRGGVAGDDMWSAECPQVVVQDGAYYLFRTTDYRAPLTHVYRSLDPLDFGVDDDRCHIGTIAVAAPEVVRDGGQDYISTVHDLRGGVQLQRLAWIDARDASFANAFRDRCTALFSFEDGTLDGWEVKGDAMRGQPTFVEHDTVRGQRVNAEGHWYIGTHEDRPAPDAPAGRTRGDDATGTLRSPPFVLPAGRITLRVGGGRDLERLYVALVLDDGDRELFRATGLRENTMRTVTWDVREHAGARARVRIVDDAKGAWGQINVDDIRIESAGSGR